MIQAVSTGCNLVVRQTGALDGVWAGVRHDGGMSVELRPWKPSDATALLRAYRANPDLAPQFGGIDLASGGAARAAIAHRLPFHETSRNWAIIENGALIGNVGLANIERRHGTAWAHYWLVASARGQGYASRALATVAEWAFRDGLYRLELGHRVNNPDSCRVAERAGFAAEGIARDKLRYGEERFDVENHARLRTDAAPEIETLAIEPENGDAVRLPRVVGR